MRAKRAKVQLSLYDCRKGLSQKRGHRENTINIFILCFICSDDKVNPKKPHPLWGKNFGKPWLYAQAGFILFAAIRVCYVNKSVNFSKEDLLVWLHDFLWLGSWLSIRHNLNFWAAGTHLIKSMCNNLPVRSLQKVKLLSWILFLLCPFP